MEIKTYKILNGPSAFELAIMLFRGAPDHYLHFTLQSGVKGFIPVQCVINGARKADKKDIKPVEWLLEGETWGSEVQSFSARYRTDKRNGTFTIFKRKKP